MLTLHHLNDSRSQRVLWLIEELGLPCEVVRWQRDDKTLRAPEGLRAVHPLGKAPVLFDGDRVFVESGAIVEHLMDRPEAASMRPAADSLALDRTRQWMHFAEGSAMTPLLLKLLAQKIPQSPMPGLARPIARQIAEGIDKTMVEPDLGPMLAWVEGELAANGPWFAGADFGAADVMMSFPLQAARAYDVLSPAAHPTLLRWVDAIEARPAWRRAIERGGPFALK